MNISGQVVKTSQLPKKTLGLGDSLLALINSPLETVTVPVSEFVTFVSNQIALGTYTLDSVTTAGNTTANVINVGGVNSPYLQLNTVSPGTQAVGRFVWNDTDGTVDLRLKGNNVTLQLGQETVVRVVNKTGADLLESQYKVVRVRIASEGGAQGQRLAVVLAQGSSDSDSVTTLGVVTENIGNNQEGFITVFGNVNAINTTGSLQGETWADGDVLFLSPTTPGALTKVKPVAPQHTVVMGYVVYAHQNNGKIFVKVDNGYELEELHDVLPTPYVNNGVLYRDTTANLWKSATISTLLGGTPLLTVPTLSQVTTAGATTSNTLIYSGSTEAIRPNVDSLGNLGANNFRWGVVYSRALSSGTNTLDINSPALNLNDTSGNIKVKLFTSTGNVTIQNGGTFTDAGYRLDVNGNVRINSSIFGQGTTNTYYQIANSDYHHRFFTRTDVGATLERFTIEGGAVSGKAYFQNTNVGIGTADPNGRLHIYELGLSAYKTYTTTNAGVIITSYQSQGSPYTKTTDIVAASDGTVPSEIRLFTRTNGSASIDERLRITSVGNVGIGTTSPSQKLDVSGAISVGTGGGVIDNVSGSDFNITAGGTTANLNFYGKGPVPLRIFGNNSSSYAPFNFNSISATNSFLGYFADWTGSNYRSRSTTAGILEFNNGIWNLTTDTGLTNMGTFTPTIRVTVLANGNMGIGTINPGSKLEVYGGNLSLKLPTYAGSARYGFGNPARTDDAAYIEYNGVGDFTGSLIFATNGSTSNVAATERMRISSTGNIGIGTTSPSSRLVVLNTSATIAALIGGGAAAPGWVGIGTVNSGALPIIQGYNNAVNVSNTISLNPSGGNVVIGTATDAGYRLDVNGTTRIQGTATITPAADTSAIVSTGYSVTGSGTTPMIDLSGTWNTTGIVNAFRINITNTASSSASNLINLQVGGNTLFRVNASSISGISTGGPIAANGYGLGNGSAGIFTVDGAGAFTSSGTSMKFSDGLLDAGYSYYFESGQYVSKNFTSGTGGFITVRRGYAPTSGTGVLNVLHLQNTINQTGGANGITRGLYIQPTLTAAADWRSIEWSNNTGWGLYGVGTAPNYVEGNLLIGSTNNFAKLYVGGGTVSSDNAFVFAQPVITTSFTNLWCFRSQIVPNGTNSITNVYHYDTRQSVMGTSTITNQFGFSAASTIVGATNNYGFYGDLPSGTGRWNLYMNGTASNYINSNLVIGTTTVNASASLQVDSTTKGFLPPRMTTAQILLISSPAEGLQVYNTDLKTICFYNGTAWQRVTSIAM